MYFVYPSPSPVDEAFWDKYGVEWIKADPDELVRALDAALRGEARG